MYGNHTRNRHIQHGSEYSTLPYSPTYEDYAVVELEYFCRTEIFYIETIHVVTTNLL